MFFAFESLNIILDSKPRHIYFQILYSKTLILINLYKIQVFILTK